MSSFPNSPAGSSVQSCATCQKAWDKVNVEVKKIDGMKDVRQRNRAISASYARLYQADPDLKWAGTAAFASKQVGCGMDGVLPYVSGAKSTLGAGNLAVYDELYPALRFYQENKSAMTNKQIMDCLKKKPGTALDPSITRGIQETMDGNSKQGALTMLKHEQQDTLQKSVYDSTVFRRSVDLDKLSGYRVAPMQFVASADCTSSDSNRIVDFGKYKGDLYTFNDRWPFAQDCATKFIDLSGNPSSSADIQQQLSKIAGASPP